MKQMGRLELAVLLVFTWVMATTSAPAQEEQASPYPAKKPVVYYKTAAEAEAAAAAEAETETEAKTKAEAEAKAKAATKAVSKTATKVEQKASIKAEPKIPIKVEPKIPVTVEPKIPVTVEPKTPTTVETKPANEEEPKPPTKAAAKSGAVDMTGKWKLEVRTSLGDGAPMLELKQEGNKLTGKYRGTIGEEKVTGEVTGETFIILFTSQGVKVRYDGAIAGNDIKGTIDIPPFGKGTFKGKRK